jgi:pimeloyl-ACP methyl ester carboxylesterase
MRGSSLSDCETELLRISFKAGGPADGPVVLLLHGWPDDASTYDRIAPALQAAGYRTIAPWLRGFGPTAFKSHQIPRSGEIAAMAQDMIDFCRVLNMTRCHVVGHDWGARIAYFLSAVCPDMVQSSVALSVGWQPGALATPGFAQARAFWYQWFMATARGQEAVRRHGKEFAHVMWTSWSPAGWFRDEDFNAVAQSFENPDWPAITLHSYQVRWEEAEPDPRYAALAQRQREVKSISVPTLMIQGGEDYVVLPPGTANAAQYFTGPYERVVLDGIGHFPTREAPQRVTELLLQFLGRHAAAPPHR